MTSVFHVVETHQRETEYNVNPASLDSSFIPLALLAADS
jgi:hypothetical protein